MEIGSPKVHPTAEIQGTELRSMSHIKEFVTIHACSLGEGIFIAERVSFKRCVLGRGVEVNAGTYMENVTVGDNAQIGPNCSLVGVWHDFDETHVSKQNIHGSVRVGEGALLGAGVIVVPGVSIGVGSVIGAGTIVTKNIPDHHICFGSPHAQTVMPIAEYKVRKKVQ